MTRTDVQPPRRQRRHGATVRAETRGLPPPPRRSSPSSSSSPRRRFARAALSRAAAAAASASRRALALSAASLSCACRRMAAEPPPMSPRFSKPRAACPPLVRRMIAAGRLGKKSGRGFYDYGDSKIYGA